MEPRPPDGPVLLDRAVHLARTARLADALPAFDEAEAEFLAAEDATGAAGVLVERARALARSFGGENLRQAQRVLDRAESLLGEAPAVGLRARLLHARGYACLRQGNVQRALRALRSAEEAFQRAGDPVGEARVLDTLGVLWERHADRERAALYLARSYALKEQAGDDEGRAITLGNLGRLALHGDRIEEAVAFFRLDLELARSLDDPRGEAVVLCNLAECDLALGRTDAARARGSAVIEIATALDDAVVKGRGHVVLADADRMEGRVGTALDHAQEAASCFAASGMSAGLARARLASSEALAAGGDQDAAARAAVGAGRAARAAGMADLAIRAFLAAHRCLADIGADRRARAWLERAQDTALASGLTDLVERVRRRRVGEALAQASREGETRITLELAAGPLAGREGEVLPLRLDGFLGEGAFAVVLRAVEPDTGQVFALKRLDHGRDRLRAVATRLRREFTAMTRVAADAPLAHPYAFGHEDGRPCLLIEYVAQRDRHRSLRDLLADAGRLEVARALQLGEDIARGLAAIHEAGIVHRDVKPGNVLLDAGGRAVLTDYGLAYDLEESAYIPAGAFVGTLAYAAPELMIDDVSWQTPTPAVDLYALGVLLYQALAGAWPFPTTSLAGLIESKRTMRVDWEALGGEPRELVDLLRELLAPDATSRPASATDVAARLAALREGT